MSQRAGTVGGFSEAYNSDTQTRAHIHTHTLTLTQIKSA